MTEIYDELLEEKVYINKTMDERYPLMVRGIYEDGKLQMVIMLWGLNWEKMTLGRANFLTVVSYLIQNAVFAGTEIYTGPGRKALQPWLPYSGKRCV